MTLPAHARVEAAPNFLNNLDAVHRFFEVQDADSAPERFRRLKADLREMVRILSWSPGSARPARFLTGRSAQGRLRVEALQQLAVQAALPDLREYVVGQHIALYAHSEAEVILLALKHKRQLTYDAEAPP